MKKLAIFDLDGTLLDSLGDLADSCNTALKEAGLPTHPTQAYRFFVGGGKAVLLERSISKEKQTPDILKKVGDRFTEIYDEICKNDSKAFDGVLDMLRRLQERGVKTAIATNKPHTMCMYIVDSLYKDTIDIAYGQQESIPKKPDPAVVHKIMQDAGVSDKSEVIYFGDSDVDIYTGLAAEVDTVGVLWGFRPREELVGAGATKLCNTIEDMYNCIVE